MILLTVGIALATAGDYYCTPTGFTLTLLGVILASVKIVVTDRLMTGSLALSAMEVLLCMSPLATVQCLMYAVFTGETSRFQAAYAAGELSPSFGVVLAINALIAFALNIVSFQTTKMAGALTMTVCGNVKQALTIGLGIVLFDVHIGVLGAAGTGIALLGAVWYSKVGLESKKAGTGQQS